AVERGAALSREIAKLTHHLQLICDFEPPVTTFMNHFINQLFLMSELRRTWWVEGPTLCGLAIKLGTRLLEIGCGTGYYTDIFFSPFAAEIVAVDIDPRAIETAQRFHQAANVRYEVMDSRDRLPKGPFDTVIWSPTIFAYTPTDVDRVMFNIRKATVPEARLCGWTWIENHEPNDRILWHDLRSLWARLKKYY